MVDVDFVTILASRSGSSNTPDDIRKVILRALLVTLTSTKQSKL